MDKTNLRLTLPLCFSMLVEKIKPIVTRKYANPHCFNRFCYIKKNRHVVLQMPEHYNTILRRVTCNSPEII